MTAHKRSYTARYPEIIYIAEFEHGGAYYAFKTGVDRSGVFRIPADLGILDA
ncbi:MAG: hypothetical protein K2N56_10250 [Oscillospiraceae bacterium]|nr:hypothetical protein [Oscillospiraceae bacterium]